MSDSLTSASPKRILIVRLGAMGDILHALPAAMLLKAAFPNAEFGWIVEQRWRELLEWSYSDRKFPDRLHLVDTRRWRKDPFSRLTRAEVMHHVRSVRSLNYDFAVDFQGAIKSGVLMALSGSRRRYGFSDPWEKPASMFYSNPIAIEAQHVAQKNTLLALEVAKRELTTFGAASFQYFEPSISKIEPCVEPTTPTLRIPEPFMILNPGAGWGAKQWPTDRYAEVARALGGDGIRSLVNYGPGEEKLAQAVEKDSDGYAVSASFTISQLIAITRRASLFIGGDTGPMHLAALLQIPVVAIFGPTDPARNGPYGTRSITLRDSASVTSHKRIQTPEAGLLNITTDQVINAARELLEANSKGVRA